MSTNDALKMLYKECRKLDLDDATQLILEAAGLGRHAPTSIRRMYIRLICLRKT
jgi:hypothetical protein